MLPANAERNLTASKVTDSGPRNYGSLKMPSRLRLSESRVMLASTLPSVSRLDGECRQLVLKIVPNRRREFGLWQKMSYLCSVENEERRMPKVSRAKRERSGNLLPLSGERSQNVQCSMFNKAVSGKPV